MEKYILLRVSLFIGLILLPSGFAASPVNAASASFDHSLYTEILQSYVDEDGGVNYQGLKEQGREKLDKYVKSLESASPSKMSEKERMAFYLNAYNAFTLKLIGDHYPLKSIRKIPNLSGLAGFGQWKEDLWTIDNKKISLDAIEHKILRPMGDPRIHFALVCAAKSCPNLARQAYRAGNLDEMLNEHSRKFNQSPKGLKISEENRFSKTRPILTLSSIYKWFREDFLLVSESLPDFVQRYAAGEVQQFIEKNQKNIKIEYMDYDWHLNDQQ